MSVGLVICLGLAASAAALAMPARPGSLLARRLGTPDPRAHATGAGLVTRLRRWLSETRLARSGRTHQQARAAVREAYDVLAAELRAGHSPSRALSAAAEVLSELGPAAAASRAGGDVPAALAGVPPPVGDVLPGLAVAWSVAAGTGAGLAAVVDRLALGVRAEDALGREVAAALAGPRATARILAALPLFGLVVGMGAGSDPLAFLLGTPLGWGCLLLGGVLAALGLVWVEHLARRAEDPR
ncbi:type II secretion system F family protein [Actinopolymorpha alba]|uniref:type II secretion system F family protein n=1 Tax=Actinopolymorpha alba TaxID=533267 RepID=UPI00036B32E3|nr:type II secretion system F family protein [Actinopolymorpha alba]